MVCVNLQTVFTEQVVLDNLNENKNKMAIIIELILYIIIFKFPIPKLLHFIEYE